MIINVYKDTIITYPDKQYKPMIANISTITDLGHETVIYTISDYRQTENVTSPNKKYKRTTLFEKIDDVDRNGIRRKIHLFSFRRELLTIN